MHYHVIFYKSKAYYNNRKASGNGDSGIGRNEQDIYHEVNIGDTINLDFTVAELKNNKNFKYFPTTPYTVANIFDSGGYHYIEVYYSGDDKFDFDNPKKK